MRRLLEVFKEKKHTFSFELFPPKTPQGYDKLILSIADLAKLQPDFISVTYGAGGSSREKTIEIVDLIQKKHKIVGVAHLTCVCHNKQEIKSILDNFYTLGIRNVLALRGDPPQDNPNWQPGPENFKYSSQLCNFIRATFHHYFGMGVAGFPEGHILCPDRDQDAKFLKLKIDAGADFVITQLFFNNQDYFDYVKRLRNLGIIPRIIPGILPITDYEALIKFCKTCGANIPQKVHDIFQPIKDDKNKTMEAGIKFAIEQCKELLEKGAPGLHFYTLNKAHPTDVILREVRGY